jgi:hypothetical protein
VRKVIALKYENEENFRYIIAEDVTWRAQDDVEIYALRWLIEVFFSDWKGREGWGQKAMQQKDTGSCRGVILSLLVDHSLLSHPVQVSRIKNGNPACTVGTLIDKIKQDSLIACIEEIVLSDSPVKLLEELKKNIDKIFVLRDSDKHMISKKQKVLEDNFEPHKEKEEIAMVSS